jgi:hypothetical protein
LRQGKFVYKDGSLSDDRGNQITLSDLEQKIASLR